MRITEANLMQAADANIITSEQAIALHQFLASQAQPQFSFTHILYYFGGLVAIGAMTLFINLGWETFGGLGIFLLCILYAAAGIALTHFFEHKNLAIPAGIAITFVLALTPLATYGLQQWLGLWPDDSVYREYHRYIRWHWIYLELATLCAGALLIWRYRYPFLLMPVAFTLWYLSMDAAAMLMDGDYDWQFRRQITLVFGIIALLLAFWVDIRTTSSKDFPFWLYLVGVLCFWSGLTLQHSDSELNKFLYFCINLALIGLGALLARKVFVIFGALGSCLYLGHLAEKIFPDSWRFPIALTAIGFGIVFFGIWWQKHERAITQKIAQHLPQGLRALHRHH